MSFIAKPFSMKIHVTILVSRDVQVRIVFCHWLAWLLRIKTSTSHGDNLKSVLNKRETRCNRPNDRATQAQETDSAEDGFDTQTGMMVGFRMLIYRGPL